MFSKYLVVIFVVGGIALTGCKTALQKGDENLRSGNFSKAIKEYDRSINNDKQLYTAHLNKGISLYRVSENREAKMAYTKAIEADPVGSSMAFRFRSELNFKDGLLDRAYSDVHEALLRDPEDPYSHNLKGRIELSRSDYVNAIRYFNSAMSLIGTDENMKSRIRYNRAQAFLRVGNYEKAGKDLAKYIKLLEERRVPVPEDDLFAYGVTQYINRDIDGAINTWDRLPESRRLQVYEVVGELH